MKTIYISGPITDQTTDQPREGWQRDFLDAEAKLRRIGFAVINPVDIAREVEEANRWQYECTSHACTCNGGPIPPSRADYIMACLQRMKLAHSFDRLHGVYIIGKSFRDVILSYGVQMEVLMAEVLDVPVYAECRDDMRINRSFLPMENHGTIEELLNGTMEEQTMTDKENNIGGYDHKAVIDERIVCEQIFPELSEDERIRQKLLFLCYSWRNNEQVNIPDKEEVEKTIDWIEKQGEHANFLSQIQVGDKVTRNEDGVLVNLSQLKRVAKKQGEQKPCMIQWKGDNLKEVIDFTGKDKNFDKWFKSFEEYEKYVHGHNDIFKLFNEDGSHYEVPVGAWIVKTPDGRNVASKSVFKQKPTDKVEQKFKVGDWVVFKNKHQSIYKVEKIEDGYYILRHTHGGTFRVCVLHDKDLRLWTLNDAKSGDVLVSSNNKPFIYNGNFTENSIGGYCGFNIYGIFVVNMKMCSWTCNRYIKPATKEQREQLEKAMADAGYTFDFEKKELKKIEHSPDDWIQELEDKLANATPKQLAEWKEKYFKEEPAWSEEDERKLELLKALVEDVRGDSTSYSTRFREMEELNNWLKTLKDRVQPQPKQGWNEDTQQWIDAIIKDYEELYDADKDHRATTQAKISVLKSIRPQNTWKPSDEQMKLLREVQQALLGKDCHNRFVNFMYELKGLREE